MSGEFFTRSVMHQVRRFGLGRFWELQWIETGLNVARLPVAARGPSGEHDFQNMVCMLNRN
jgi:hypothetical protein